MSNPSKEQMLAELKRLLHESLRLAAAGATHDKLAHARGKVDGFIQALLSAEIASQAELLALVCDARKASAGPAVRVIEHCDALPSQKSAA